jgi:MoxR-like ATPase
MPGDITGTDVLSGGSFRFEPGPLFAQIVLADEINRATPKTQSALLEGMQERTVTSSGVRHELPSPFFVLGTQNPIEMAGTYPLPEAQLDRFMLKLLLGVPSAEEISQILERTAGASEPQVHPVATAEDVLRAQELVRQVPAASGVRSYAARLVRATHPADASACDDVKRSVRHGASPRAAQALVLCGKVFALLAGRYHLAHADVRRAAPSALRHRLVLNLEAHARGVSADQLVALAVERTPEEAA